MPSFDSAGSSSEINEQAQHEAYGSDNETASRRILISICLRDWLYYAAGRAFLFGGLGDSGADCFLIPFRPRFLAAAAPMCWFRRFLSLSLRYGCDSVDVPHLIR